MWTRTAEAGLAASEQAEGGRWDAEPWQEQLTVAEKMKRPGGSGKGSAADLLGWWVGFARLALQGLIAWAEPCAFGSA